MTVRVGSFHPTEPGLQIVPFPALDLLES
jgi:hypothetical protein